MSSSAAVSIRLEQKVATFAAQHALLTRELDELERLAAELPSLEKGLELSKESIAAAEGRISQGRDKLHKEWQAHSELTANTQPSGITGRLKSKVDTQAKAKLEQEYQVYQEALNRWSIEEATVIEAKSQHIVTLQKYYDCRDRAARYERLCTHLDQMHAIVLGDEKIETAEWDYLDWQVHCAHVDEEATRGQLDAELKLMPLVTGLHTLLSQADRHYTKVMEIIAQYPAWWQLTAKEVRDEPYLTIGGAFGFIARYIRPKIDEKLAALTAHNATGSRQVSIPALPLFPTRSVEGVTTIDGRTIQLHTPSVQPAKESETNKSFARAVEVVKYGLRLMEVERESVQRRADELAIDNAQAQIILQSEMKQRRAMRRAWFERIAAEQAVHTPPPSVMATNNSLGARTAHQLDSGLQIPAGAVSLPRRYQLTTPSSDDNEVALQDQPPAYAHDTIR
ncbi:hypothetical protein BKA62DRAFT_773966 [Auriculariales sp. MPI-PUGE-AT-0066]|nr:hypothetical protein BKA62DRAFT_773966 [Auriculariales sp. MPI-PUGE-AT-0066]